MTVGRKVEIVEQLFGTRFGLLRAQAVDWSTQFQVLPDRQRVKEREVFRQHADAALDLEGRIANGQAVDQASPAEGFRIPVSILTVVDLPLPFGPGNPKLAGTYAEGVREFQPKVASTLGISVQGSVTLKALAKASLQIANAFSVLLFGLDLSQG